MMSRWNEKGFFSKSALSDTDSQKFRGGKAASRITNLDAYPDEYIRHPEWGVKYANLVSDVSNLPFTQDAMATVSYTHLSGAMVYCTPFSLARA